MNVNSYPDAVDPNLVGTYSPLANAGGGYVWDHVLEYRVWCHPERGSSDIEDGSDYYYPFATYAEALAFSQSTVGAEAPLALIRQLEYIAEDNPGEYRHVKEVRIAEWPVEFLRRPRRTQNTIPDFLAPNAPANRLDILRGLGKSESGIPTSGVINDFIHQPAVRHERLTGYLSRSYSFLQTFFRFIP